MLGLFETNPNLPWPGVLCPDPACHCATPAMPGNGGNAPEMLRSS
jgi:hypothetical protein